jgi:hypothetical protein
LIKKCRCDFVEVTIQACLVVASEESNLWSPYCMTECKSIIITRSA